MTPKESVAQPRPTDDLAAKSDERCGWGVARPCQPPIGRPDERPRTRTCRIGRGLTALRDAIRPTAAATVAAEAVSAAAHSSSSRLVSRSSLYDAH